MTRLICSAWNGWADFIRENLTRIRHTSVYVEQVEAEDLHYEPKYKEVGGTVASVRLDKLLALAFMLPAAADRTH